MAADEELQAGRGRVLVFARDVASAEATADALQGACGLPVLRYHKVGRVGVSGWRLVGGCDGGSGGRLQATSECEPGQLCWASARRRRAHGLLMRSYPPPVPCTRPAPPCPPLHCTQAVPAAERAEALARISQGAGLVLVCTDAAARGLDVPDVTHVVQVRLGLLAFLFVWQRVVQMRTMLPHALSAGACLG